MSLKNSVAGVLRAIRAERGLKYGDLADVSAKNLTSNLERGLTNITIDKMAALACALDFEPVAFLTLCVAVQEGVSPESVLARAATQLENFEASGGHDLLGAQFMAGELVGRPRGKPVKQENAAAVRRLRDAGKTKTEVIRELGLAKSTVYRYWTS